MSNQNQESLGEVPWQQQPFEDEKPLEERAKIAAAYAAAYRDEAPIDGSFIDAAIEKIRRGEVEVDLTAGGQPSPRGVCKIAAELKAEIEFEARTAVRH